MEGGVRAQARVLHPPAPPPAGGIRGSVGNLERTKRREIDTACIITTAANRLLAPIHDRMPVVIAPEAFDLWLDCAKVDAETAAPLIVPAPENLFEAYEISTAVNRTANDSAALIAPLGAQPDPAAAAPAAKPKKKDDGQASLF
jgi:hypothetical protein